MKIYDRREFKIGNRVKVIKACEDVLNFTVGDTGTVKGTKIYGNGDVVISVEFDKCIDGHDCNGLAKHGHGWYFWTSEPIKNRDSTLRLVQI